MHKENALSLADMMSALMMTFMFVSLAFLAKLESTEKSFRNELNSALHAEFDDDLSHWKAEITPGNTFRFHSPFAIGSPEIPNNFALILNEFCPRYVALLTKSQFKDKISEIRVEGHTSKGWNENTSAKESFIKNMQLSQARASSVLSYCYLLDDQKILSNLSWYEAHVHANGLASSKPIFVKGKISPKLSRRVDFNVVSQIN